MKGAQTSVPLIPGQVESFGAAPTTADDSSQGRAAQAQPRLVEPEPERLSLSLSLGCSHRGEACRQKGFYPQMQKSWTGP
jgi:hypothetical protein